MSSGKKPKRVLAVAVAQALESRQLLSVFYDYDLLAQTGMATTTGDAISSFVGETSINDNGRAAFIANVTGPNGNGRAIIATPAGTGTPVKISLPNPQSGRNYDVAQITNDNRVVASDSTSGARLLRTWDADNPGTATVITRTDTAPLNAAPGGGTYDIVQLASRAEDGDTAYIGFTSTQPTPAQVFIRGSVHKSMGDISGGGLRLSAGNGGIVVTRAMVSGNQAIVVYSKAIASSVLASVGAGGFTALGQPSISDDGQILAFAGQQGTNSGVWMSYATAGASFFAPFQVAGLSSELGFDAAGNAIRLTNFDVSVSPGATLSNRVGVVHRPAGAPGIAGDTILLSFIATPSAASRANVHIAANPPLLYTANKGLWTLKIFPRLSLGSTSQGTLHFDVRTSPMPVAQVGDTIGGHAITDIFTYDPIATAVRDRTGSARATINDGDHFVAFRATYGGGEMVVRAAQLDTDSDGLYDQWERAGGGVDIDQDGTVDLDLNAMGANPMRKDLFLELDWLKPDTAAGLNFAPQPQALTTLANMFANAPLTNPTGTSGVNLHIDAGPIAGLSQNMGAGSLQGGDNIAQTGTGNHIHIVYFGQTDPMAPFPGTNDSLGRPVGTRSMEDIKKNFFSTTDKGARELAFKYTLMADHYDVVTNTNGALVNFNNSTGLGEAGQFGGVSTDPYLPGNDYLVTLQGFRGPPGNVFTVPTPGPGVAATARAAVGFMQSNTLAHELGHTLGLLHGGVDFRTSPPPTSGNYNAANYKPAYGSLMNYAYQLNPGTNGTFITDYSRAGDPVYDDWANVNFAFNQYFEILGGTPAYFSRGATTDPSIADEHDDYTLDDFVADYGPLDATAPSLTINSPAPDVPVATGSNVTVNLTASDAGGLSSVRVSFDVNGDGTLSPDETIDAVPNGPNAYQAVFNNVSGPAGPRTISASANDNVGFTTERAVSVNVGGGGDTTPPTVTASTFNFNAAPHSLSFRFSEDVKDSLGLSDLSVQNLTNPGQVIPASFTYDANTNTVTFTFAGVLPDGNYRATLQANSVSDAAGNKLQSDQVLDFFVLAADANRDRVVDHLDFDVLFANFGKPGGKLFAEGDFNYDGQVDFLDFQALERAFGKSMPAAQQAPAPSAAPVFSLNAAKPRKAVKPKLLSVPGLPARRKPL
jgi:hypothetical protein